MTTAPDPLDLHARQLHAGAVLNVSAPTLARLRQARHSASAQANAAPTRWRAPWLTGGAVAAALALALVLRPEPPATTAATVAAANPASTQEPAGTLQEDPAFYLWLASADAPALALE